MQGVASQEENSEELTTKEKIEYLLNSQSSDYCGSQTSKDRQTTAQSAVVSLIEQEKTQKENSVRRKYRKDLHFLKLVYEERLSRMSSSERGRRKPALGKVCDNFGKSDRSSKFELFKKPLSFASSFSRLNSSASSSSKKISKNFEDYFPQGNKNLSLNDLLKNKKSFLVDVDGYPSLRKKVIRKIYDIFFKEKNLDKNFSKKLSIFLEDKFNLTYNHKSQLYLEKIKSFCKKFRVSRTLTLDGPDHNRLLEDSAKNPKHAIAGRFQPRQKSQFR